MSYSDSFYLVIYYSMPLEGEIRQKWIEKIEMYQEIQSVYTYINVCSLHFVSQHILKNGKLKKGAVPTILEKKQLE